MIGMDTDTWSNAPGWVLVREVAELYASLVLKEQPGLLVYAAMHRRGSIWTAVQGFIAARAENLDDMIRGMLDWYNGSGLDWRYCNCEGHEDFNPQQALEEATAPQVIDELALGIIRMMHFDRVMANKQDDCF